jgi:DNA polymerase elongation subunit (family B)
MNYIAKLLLNSLYGRFGMDDSFISTKIISKADYLKFETEFKESILDLLDLEDNFLVQFKDPKIELNTLLDNGKETHNVNFAIAAAVTAYARIHMSQFKNNNSLPRLYYSDTDSLYFDGPLPNSLVDPKKLGALKLEGFYDDATFLAPKVYALKNQDGLIVKIKGLSKESIVKNSIDIELLDKLLFKDSNLKFTQNKWFKHLDKASINILDQVYTLKATGNKRNLVYNEDNKL